MVRLIWSEALKFGTTRACYMTTVGALVIITAAGAAVAGLAASGPGGQPVRDALAVAALSQAAGIATGVLAAAGEFRYDTITAAYLITPRRLALLTAKVIICAVAGLASGALAFGALAAVVVSMASLRGVASPLRGLAAGASGTSIAAMIYGGATATALAAVLGAGLGAGLGAVARNQAGAIAAACVFLYGIEPSLTIVPGVGAAIGAYGPGALYGAAAGIPRFPAAGHPPGQLAACLLLALYAVPFLFTAAVLIRRRDIIC